MKSKALWINTFFAWLVFVGIDFIFHGAILQHMWEDQVTAFKSLEDLAILIPAGYASFFLLTLLITFTFHKSFPEPPSKGGWLQFALIWSLLFAASNFLGMYSYLEIPLKHLVVFNFVYLIEIFTVVFLLKGLYFNANKRRIRWWCVGIFFMFIVVAIVIQNVMANI